MTTRYTSTMVKSRTVSLMQSQSDKPSNKFCEVLSVFPVLVIVLKIIEL